MSNTILITGASSGIGKATAAFFHEKGWNVIATMRQPQKEDELGKLENLLVTKLDVQDTRSIATAIRAGIERFGSIEVLLNNAGYGAFGILEAATSEQIRRQYDVNVIGLLETTKAILPHFRANKNGVLINVSSIGGRMTFPLGTLYHGTKFAVEGISEALGYELSQIGVRVKIVEPGAVQTDFGTRSLDFFNDEGLAEYQQMVGSTLSAFEQRPHPASQPRQVAEVIFRAATDGTDQLRYRAGEDAEEILSTRDRLSDSEFQQEMRKQFGL